MKDPLMLMIIIFNFIILAPISVILRSWRERGTLTEKKFAITLTAYFSFSFVTSSNTCNDWLSPNNRIGRCRCTAGTLVHRLSVPALAL